MVHMYPNYGKKLEVSLLVGVLAIIEKKCFLCFLLAESPNILHSFELRKLFAGLTEEFPNNF